MPQCWATSAVSFIQEKSRTFESREADIGLSKNECLNLLISDCLKMNA